MTFDHIRVSPVTPTIGAMIDGVDLNNVESTAIYDEIARALHRHQVVFLRNQPLTPESHRALARHFGETESHEFMPHADGHAEIQLVAHEGYGASNTARWHTDVTYRKRPTLVSVLRAAELPEGGGGDTLWCSTGAAFEALPDPLKAMLLGMRAVHDLPFHRMLRRDPFLQDGAAAGRGRAGWGTEDEIKMLRDNPPVVHPAVISHPVTGRLTLFVNSNWTKKFADIDTDLSRHLLTMLWEWIRKPEFHVRFAWEKDSVAIWDNFATQHYAVFDYAPARRVMQRIIAGSAEPGLDLARVPAHLRPTGAAAAE